MKIYNEPSGGTATSDGRVDGVGHEVEWGSNPNRGSAQWEEDKEKK